MVMVPNGMVLSLSDGISVITINDKVRRFLNGPQLLSECNRYLLAPFLSPFSAASTIGTGRRVHLQHSPQED